MGTERKLEFKSNPFILKLATLAAATSLLFLAGCNPMTPQESEFSALTEEVETGAEKEIKSEFGENIKLNYTGVGQGELFKRIQQDIGPNVDDELAQSITDVKVEKTFDESNSSNTPKSLYVALVLKIEDKNYGLNFEVPLKQDAGKMVSNFTTAKNHASYLIKATCFDLNCDKIDLRFRNLLSSEEKSVGALYLKQSPRVVFQKPQEASAAEENNQAPFEPIDRAIEKGTFKVEQESVSVTNGVSYSRGKLKDGEKVIGQYSSDRLSTAESGFQSKLELTGNSKGKVVADTIGNNSYNGKLALEINKKNEDGTTSPLARMLVDPTIDGDQTSHVVVEANPENRLVNPVIPVPLNDAYPNIKSTFNKLASYESDPTVQEFIKYWKGEKPNTFCGGVNYHYGRNRASNYFRKIQPLLPYFLAISQAVDVSPEIAYLSAIESNFAATSGDEYVDGEVASSARTSKAAAGSFQILYPTALDITNRFSNTIDGLGFQMPVYPLRNKSVNENDFRNYAATSFLGASLLMRENFQTFPKDPAMAVLAYRKGPSGAAILRKCAAEADEYTTPLTPEAKARKFDTCVKKNHATQSARLRAFKERHHNYQTTLNDLVEYRIGTNCDLLHYVYGWLALKFIGNKPVLHGFEDPRYMDIENLTPSIYYQNQPFPLTPVNAEEVRQNPQLISI